MTVPPVCALAFSSSCRGFPRVYSAAVCKNHRVSMPSATGASQQAPRQVPTGSISLVNLPQSQGLPFRGLLLLARLPEEWFTLKNINSQPTKPTGTYPWRLCDFVDSQIKD